MKRALCIGVLTTPLARGETGGVQILPAGTFRASDGRPAECDAWRLDDVRALPLIARLRHRGRDLLIDYEHQTLHAAQNGQEAPAAGWLAPSALAFDAAAGLRAASIKWCVAAEARIEADEYRYLSPVIGYDPGTGAVVDIYHIALTNSPAVEMEPIRASLRRNSGFRDFQHEESYMKLSEKIASLMQEHGYKSAGDLATAAAVAEPVITAALASEQVPEAADLTRLAAALKVPESDLVAPAPDAGDALRVRLAAAAGLAEDAGWDAILGRALGVADSGEPALAAALGARRTGAPGAAGDAGTAAIAALQAEVAALRGAQQGAEVEQIIRGALDDGRLLPGMVDWARKLGTDDIAALRAFIAAAQPIAALRGTQSGGTEPPGASGRRMTAGQSEVARRLGISEERWARGAAGAGGDA